MENRTQSVRGLLLVAACLLGLVAPSLANAADERPVGPAPQADVLSQITEVKISYWRALRGEIEQTIGFKYSGEIYRTTAVYPERRGEDRPSKVIQTPITIDELKPLLLFVNDPKIRRAFAESRILVQPDGEMIVLTVEQNGLGVIFTSQIAFRADAPEAHQRFGVLIKEMLKRGGMAMEQK